MDDIYFKGYCGFVFGGQEICPIIFMNGGKMSRFCKYKFDTWNKNLSLFKGTLYDLAEHLKNE